ncbi:MAG: hypothetical protein A3J10_02620 [Candidatus Sungbacteria bacterium RIFCSPLOWO2_02_FULL_54_10]|uniref:Polymerase nucleotidyl transferase domain-containing protein n=2 Tax=Candidatus Yanofskyibacteriota TaxID=1752733 RepID=A0A1F8FWC3_9BACT|nr:MAG: hypothetical protein UU70_C0007G0003 [Candidatus Yanofskybacteria bacterium GW2011_GWA1_41_6]OGN16639.1 MAG: hypothetical protein A3C88_02245 [Candidatus Yanofskybacteria bacterium RIFCSPHIGHO2_02_FULL_50_12]OHA13634.1 MAG: hypothetical protein A3J10_02620 [Candidatus Sungbacteria bacterium RIFCSPLOWO2_02_FULL_54_10]
MEVKKAILATVAYYDKLDYPLTLFEVHRFLINPKRLFVETGGLGDIALSEIADLLDELQDIKVVEERRGMYMLAGRSSLVTERIEREKIAGQKWKTFVRKAWWLQFTPWIRGMFASGSLALDNTVESSDFDILVVAQPRRIYLARLALSTIASLLGARRTKHDAEAPDKFCFNHYITADRLTIPHQSLFNAQTYAHLTPVWPDKKLAGEFFAANLWINKFVYNFKPHQDMILKTVTESRTMRSIARFIERIFDNAFGNVLERWAKRYQQRRIVDNPTTHAPGGRVVYTDHELEFHPRSFERVVLDAYNNALLHLAISSRPEPDSGLNR